MKLRRWCPRRRTSNAASAGVAALALVGAGVLLLVGCTTTAPTPTCSHSTGAEDASQQNLLDQLELYGLWSPTWGSPPGAGDLGHPVSTPFGFDPHRRVWLTTILLAPGVSGRVSIVKPQDAQLFVASNWDRMGTLTAAELQIGAARSVYLEGCDGIASYPGLTIVDGPECVVFAVQQDGDDRIAQISVPFFGAEC